MDTELTADHQERLATFDRAAAVATAVVAGIGTDQFDLPSPCDEWTVRGVLNHMVTGNLMTEAMVGGRPRPDRNVDRLGEDPPAAFAASVAGARAALTEPGLMERNVTTPLGEAPGSFLVQMRVAELVVHSWDLAKATGQHTDLDPELAADVLAQWEAGLGGRPRAMTAFKEPRTVPADATAADRLAGYLGRSVEVP
ncbi:MAG TPA: TIGR03086 family metal-binding protein [Pseudonocardiaceae bacterium]|jgi:uncharacterized protein (TIGR03086 family)|nr:TIGR03086 family metal-binding protein [Pseudonocardiaceae bacterium]